MLSSSLLSWAKPPISVMLLVAGPWPPRRICTAALPGIHSSSSSSDATSSSVRAGPTHVSYINIFQCLNNLCINFPFLFVNTCIFIYPPVLLASGWAGAVGDVLGQPRPRVSWVPGRVAAPSAPPTSSPWPWSRSWRASSTRPSTEINSYSVSEICLLIGPHCRNSSLLNFSCSVTLSRLLKHHRFRYDTNTIVESHYVFSSEFMLGQKYAELHRFTTLHRLVRPVSEPLF